MADAKREAWITGIGIVSSLGECPDAHWQGLEAGKPVFDASTFPPCIVHPLASIDFDKQIPKKGDQRQMEAWQRIGTYSAGLAVPFLVAAWAMESFLDWFQRFRKYLPWVMRASGILLIFVSLLMVTGEFTRLAGWLQGLTPEFLKGRL